VPTDLLNGGLTSLLNMVAASGGLGTAAYGLVDITKAFGGGISNFGLKQIRKALQPFEPALREIDQLSPMDVIRANWLNGLALADQKASAKALIRLGLSPENASALAEACSVDADALTVAANKIKGGSDPSPGDAHVLEKLDAAIDVALEGGFQRGDQQYRNASKLAGALASIGLALIGGGATHAQGGAFSLQGFLFSQDFLVALLIGLTASPLAPVVKDLSSLLSAIARPTSAAKQ
jgi:hypothetical protein